MESLTAFAPAKINLNLHVTGRLDDGYHTLQSVIVFCDIGDELSLLPAKETSLIIQGPFGDSLDPNSNLVLDALRLVQDHHNITQNYAITLQKNLPVASGIGGGTSDAAAITRCILTAHHKEMSDDLMLKLTKSIGADFPACFLSRPCLVEGIGDIVTPTKIPSHHIVLVNPLQSCSTVSVFKNHKRPFQNKSEDILNLQTTQNELTEAAITFIPAIQNCLNALQQCSPCQLVRMSGSGATVFGLFENKEDAEKSAQTIRLEHPEWWVQSGETGSHFN